MVRQAGDTVGGRYRLVRPLAEGGMGAVWVARHEALDVDVAIKFVSIEGADAAIEARFHQEARAAAKLVSEHVVRVHDFGIDGGSPYLAMELLHGEDLSDVLGRTGPLSPRRAAEVVQQICDGLEIAHEAGVVHRDVKPSNLFMARAGKREIVKILDFGIAKQQSSREGGATTSVGTMVGSPPYMSPEQARARSVDHRSDLWSVGAVAFEMVTGRRIFAGDSLTDTVAKICSDPIPRASDSAPELGPAFDEFFIRAFQRDVDRRFQSATEFASAFAAAVDGVVPAAPRPGRDVETISIRADAATLAAVESERPSRGRGVPFALTVVLALVVAGAAVLWLRAPADTGRSATEDVAATADRAPASVPQRVSPAPRGSSPQVVVDVTPPPSSAPVPPSAVPGERRAPRAAPRVGSVPPRRTPAPPAPTADPVFGLPSRGP